MGSLLEVLVTFIGVMLILALAAQSVQEMIKIIFAIKSQTALRALRGLIGEAADATGLAMDGDAIFQSVIGRLRGLGQDGVRKSKVRLDTLTPETLASLIESATQVKGSSLEATSDAKSDDRLKDVAIKVKEWFPLAWEPVGERYGRRMRGLAILSAAVVVIGFNADAFAVLRRAREDPAYRAAVTASAVRLDSLSERVRALSDTTAGDTSAAGRRARADSLRATRDTLNAVLKQIQSGQAGFVLGGPGGQRWDDINWWIGILLSTLLVSLGAPFWHDALEAVFGLKNRIRAEAKAMASGNAPPPAPTVLAAAPTRVPPAPITAPKPATPPAAPGTPPPVSRLAPTQPAPPAGGGPGAPAAPKPPVK